MLSVGTVAELQIVPHNFAHRGSLIRRHLRGSLSLGSPRQCLMSTVLTPAPLPRTRLGLRLNLSCAAENGKLGRERPFAAFCIYSRFRTARCGPDQARIHTAIFGPPFVKHGTAHAVFTALLHGSAAFHPAQHAHDLGLGKPCLFHRNLFVHPAEKIQLPHPFNIGG